MSVSLDGFSAPGRGTSGSVDRGDARHHANLEMLGRAGVIAMGRGACVEMAQAWATSDSPMARLINALPKVVFSTSLDAVDWPNASVNAGPVEEEIPRLKAEPGGDIVVFGGPLSRRASSVTASSTSTGSPSIRQPSATEAR